MPKDEEAAGEESATGEMSALGEKASGGEEPAIGEQPSVGEEATTGEASAERERAAGRKGAAGGEAKNEAANLGGDLDDVRAFEEKIQAMHAAAARRELRNRSDVWRRSAFRNEPVRARSVLEWVADNLCVASLKPRSAPNSTAWGLLQWALASAANRSAFYGMWAKLLPTRAQANDKDEIDDDTGLLDDINFIMGAKQNSVLPVCAEGDDGEPAVPPADGDAQRPG